jgi:hypothetical protein
MYFERVGSVGLGIEGNLSRQLGWCCFTTSWSLISGESPYIIITCAEDAHTPFDYRVSGPALDRPSEPVDLLTIDSRHTNVTSSLIISSLPAVYRAQQRPRPGPRTRPAGCRPLN